MGVGVSSPRIVGRSQQLDTLSEALARAAAGEPAIVVVVGAAGVGKSRLVGEFSTAATAAGALVLVGNCLDLVGGGLPYGPLAAILRDLARTMDAERLDVVLGPARGELARLVPELAGATQEPAGSDLDATDTPDVDASRGQARLFEHLLAVLGRLGAGAPTVLLLEDVHWIDPATRDLVTFLTRNLRQERVVVILTSRSEHLPRAHPHAAWLAELDRSPRTGTVTLEPLSAEETLVQLESILGASPAPGLAAAVHRRSEGNPLFNEELLAAARSGSSTLPSILLDALGAKIRTLPGRSVDVLGVAAVASRSVDERFLAAILGGVEDDYLDPVRAAVVGQVLVAAQSAYRFRHGLYAEAILADLTPGERRSLHGRIATALEANPDLAEGGPAWVAGESADHWLEADRPADAYRCAVQAGLAASAMYAHPVALARWEQALALDDRVGGVARAKVLGDLGFDESELLMRAAQVAALSEAHDRALELAGRAVAFVDSEAQPARSAVLRSQYARVLWGAGHFEPAHEMFREAASLVEAGSVADKAQVLGRYAMTLLWRGQLDEGVEVAREAVASARESRLRGVEVEALDALGSGLWFAGSINEAIDRLREARQVGLESGSIEEYLFVSDSLSECLVDADRFEEALAVATLGGAEAARLGIDRPYGAMFLGNAGLALFCLGRWAEAESMTASGMDVGHGRVWGLSVRARLLAALGRTADARTVLDAVQAMFPEGLPEAARLVCGLPAAEVRLIEGDAAGALDVALEALDVEWPHVGLRLALAATGLRAAADIAQDRRAHRDNDGLSRTKAFGGRCLAEVDAQRAILTGWDSPTPSKLATADLAEAELARLNGVAEPERWAAIADAFEAVPMPYPAAYARYRQAEATLVQGGVKASAGDLLRAADGSARALGAAPLVAAIARLARQARIELSSSAGAAGRALDAEADVPVGAATGAGVSGGRGSAASPPAAPTRRDSRPTLSARELQVLALVAAGRTNGQIASELYISPKTASVHVTHILDKLGASNRVEAAMIAARAGLLEGESS